MGLLYRRGDRVAFSLLLPPQHCPFQTSLSSWGTVLPSPALAPRSLLIAVTFLCLAVIELWSSWPPPTPTCWVSSHLQVVQRLSIIIRSYSAYHLCGF